MQRKYNSISALFHLTLALALFILYPFHGFSETPSWEKTTKIAQQTYHVVIPATSFTGVVNQPLKIPVSIRPSKPSSGKFYSVMASLEKKPSQAKAKSLPATTYVKVTGSKAGIYQWIIQVNLMGKSSCGGIDIDELASRKVEVVLK